MIYSIYRKSNHTLPSCLARSIWIWLFVWDPVVDVDIKKRPRDIPGLSITVDETAACQLHPVVVPHSVQILHVPFRTIFVLLQLGQISPYNISDVSAAPEGSVACATGRGDESMEIPVCQSGGLI